MLITVPAVAYTAEENILPKFLDNLNTIISSMKMQHR